MSWHLVVSGLHRCFPPCPLSSRAAEQRPWQWWESGALYKGGGLHWERGTSRELGRILMADTTFCSLKARMLQLHPLLPFRKPHTDRQGHHGPFLPGPETGEAEGRPMLFGKLHCVCVKAKEQEQDNVTSTISSFFSKSLFIWIYKEKSAYKYFRYNFSTNY